MTGEEGDFILIYKPLSIYLVRLPLPFSLNHVNCYAIKGNEGWWLIDTGLNTHQSKIVWKKFMDDNQIVGNDIKGIYITHIHPDHFDAAGWLQELSGAPIFISEADAEELNRVWHRPGQVVTERVIEQLKRNGMPLELIYKVTDTIPATDSFAKSQPVLSVIEPGKLVQLGDSQCTTVFTPGHSDGHMSYFNEEYGVLFSGDLMLARIPSNVSLRLFGQADPLKSYLESLNIVRSLPCEIVMPAHGSSFENIGMRINELEDYHDKRLNQMKEFISEGSTAYEICRRVLYRDLDNHDLRFAMMDTLAHLMHLVYRGELEVNERNGIDLFTYRNSDSIISGKQGPKQ